MNALKALILASSTLFSAPFTVTPNTDATALAQTILGAGVTIIGTPVLTGNAAQFGTFIDFTTGPYTNAVTSGVISIPQGLILGTGAVQDADGTYIGGASTSLNGPGDAQLSAISGFPTFDAATLSFNFIPSGNEVILQYLFASTEYPDYVDSGFSDVFAFYVNGTNVALAPGTTDGVTIGNINAAVNSQYFTQYSTVGVTPYNYGGSTVLLVARAFVNPGMVNTFRFAIADTGDDTLDSAVLLGTGMFSTTNPIPEPGTWVLLASGIGAMLWLRRQ